MHPVDMAGTRIRERRIIRGLKQAELAHAAGISASYLNLIEHNRRRIGGRTLLQIAEVLEVEPTLIREGVQTSLLTTLREIAKQVPPPVNEERELEPELDRVEEFAGRFPGWAQLIANLNNQNSELQQNVNFLTERLSNDPKLSDALHEVISTVTAIRSTASILADTRELEPEWLMRFHRNINEDGKRLAQGAETLVKYLEGGPNADSDVLAPVEEVEAFLAHHSYHFAELEQDLGQEGDAEQCLDQFN
ncbi:MAG: helix-turn-helix transcriptional regulator, partial [Pseudomonadota bacterium]